LHLPISTEAQEEVKKYVASDKNILKPGSGEPIIAPTQEIIL
jgi:DNA-directed RNA polymerase beta' subunit